MEKPIRDFKSSYDGPPPPWDIGRPQQAFLELVGRAKLVSPALDAGCGTGENTMLLAERGLSVLGIDSAERAIELANKKAAERGSAAKFEVADALQLEKLGRTFATIIDSALYHVFDDEDRAQYVESLAKVIQPGGFYYMLVFSDLEPKDWGGPRRISQDEIKASFGAGWRIHSIVEARVETLLHPGGSGHGWFSTIERLNAG